MPRSCDLYGVAVAGALAFLCYEKLPKGCQVFYSNQTLLSLEVGDER